MPLDVFSEHSFFRPSVDLIAKRARVSKALIFWYFKNRDELVLEVARKSLPVDVIDDCIRKGLRGGAAQMYWSRVLRKYEDRRMRLLFLHVISASVVYPQIGEKLRELCTTELEEISMRAFGASSRKHEVKLRAFMGALLCYTIHEPEIDKENYVRTLVDIVVDRA